MARTKTIHVIEYTDKGADLKIPLKLATEPGYRGAHAPEFEYQINLDQPIHVRLVGKDPEVLTKALFAALDKHFEISWEPYLYVRVTFGKTNCNYSGSNTEGREMTVLMDYVLVGTRPDGSKVHDFYDAVHNPFDGKAHKPRYDRYGSGLPETSPMEKRWSSREDVESKALIPDTPANRASLDSIHTGMEKLARQLGDLLSPKKITTTIANMPTCLGIGFSPAPSTSHEPPPDA
jgi:hypothetical protein